MVWHPIYWAEYHVLIYTQQPELMKLVGSHGSLSLLFMTMWHFWVTNNRLCVMSSHSCCFSFGLAGTPRNSQPSKCCCGVFVDFYRYVLFSHGRFKVINTKPCSKKWLKGGVDREKEFDVVRFYQGCYISSALAMHHCSGCYMCPDCSDFCTAHLQKAFKNMILSNSTLLRKYFRCLHRLCTCLIQGGKFTLCKKLPALRSLTKEKHALKLSSVVKQNQHHTDTQCSKLRSISWHPYIAKRPKIWLLFQHQSTAIHLLQFANVTCFWRTHMCISWIATVTNFKGFAVRVCIRLWCCNRRSQHCAKKCL